MVSLISISQTNNYVLRIICFRQVLYMTPKKEIDPAEKSCSTKGDDNFFTLRVIALVYNLS